MLHSNYSKSLLESSDAEFKVILELRLKTNTDQQSILKKTQENNLTLTQPPYSTYQFDYLFNQDHNNHTQERSRKQSQNEGKAINVCISHFTHLISNMKNKSNMPEVYRNSKLTKCLQRYIENGAQLSLIMTINQEPQLIQSQRTLNFSSDVGAIKTIIRKRKCIPNTEQSALEKQFNQKMEYMQIQLNVQDQQLKTLQQEKQQELASKQQEVDYLQQENLRLQQTLTKSKQIDEQIDQSLIQQASQLKNQLDQKSNDDQLQIPQQQTTDLGLYREQKKMEHNKQQKHKMLTKSRRRSLQQFDQEEQEQENNNEGHIQIEDEEQVLLNCAQEQFEINKIDELLNQQQKLKLLRIILYNAEKKIRVIQYIRIGQRDLTDQCLKIIIYL